MLFSQETFFLGIVLLFVACWCFAGVYRKLVEKNPALGDAAQKKVQNLIDRMVK